MYAIRSYYGKTEKVSVSYKGSVGFTTPIKLPRNATAWDYMALYDEANANDLRNDQGVPGGFVYGPDLIETWKNSSDRDAYPNSDEMREAYKKRAAETHRITSYNVCYTKLLR